MKHIAIVLTFLITQSIIAQKKGKDTTIFTYGSNKVNLTEFDRNFRKNDKPGTKYSAKDVDEYLELYKKFKLKVQDAYANGIDTTADFKNELATYRKQIAKPYMMDKKINDQLVNEAYERMLLELRASHILILCKSDASPADTLAAYNKIKGILNDIKTNKMSFDVAAQTSSEDPSAVDNKGDLGYFTAFQMVYEFENAAFNTAVGETSQIFRTEFGYHIVKVVDKRKSKGDMSVKHILIQTNPDPSMQETEEANSKIQEVYKKLLAGEPFDRMVQQYSEDASTVARNGELAPFSMTNFRMPDNFKNAAFDLQKDGDFSKPFQTQAGFHIIQRIALKPVAPLKDLNSSILSKIGRDSRQYKNTLASYKKAENYYKVKETPKNLTVYKTEIDSSLIKNTYQFIPYKLNQKKFDKLAKAPLFTLQKIKKVITVKDFGIWLQNNQSPVETNALSALIDNYYKRFKMETIMSTYENNLETINDTFAALYKEYKEGILLFTLTDKKVWTKSTEDTTGLKNFYEQNKSKYVYGDRFDATIFRCMNKQVADDLKKDLDNGITLDSIMRKNNKINPLNLANPKTGKFEKGDDANANFLFEAGKTDMKYLIFEDPKTSGAYILIQIHKFMPSAQKSLMEAKGPITSDYQNYLENQWIDSLRAKYPIVVSTEILNLYKNRVTR